jgi:uncharacterized membrane protein (UPF0127 family)
MIKNVTKGSILANKCTLCTNFLTRGIGLMLKKKITPTILAFKKPNTASIHTFFMRKGIDVLFLDSNCRVASLVRGLSPWKIHSPRHKAMFIIELPEGTIKKSGVSVGDVISFK